MRFLVAALLLAAGAATALATVALHQLWWGLLLGTAATLAGLLGLPRGWLTRLPYAAGWAGMVGYLTLPPPGGGYAIGADTSGYAVAGLALVLLVAAVATLPRPGRGAGRTDPASLDGGHS